MLQNWTPTKISNSTVFCFTYMPDDRDADIGRKQLVETLCSSIRYNNLETVVLECRQLTRVVMVIGGFCCHNLPSHWTVKSWRIGIDDIKWNSSTVLFYSHRHDTRIVLKLKKRAPIVSCPQSTLGYWVLACLSTAGHGKQHMSQQLKVATWFQGEARRWNITSCYQLMAMRRQW